MATKKIGFIAMLSMLGMLALGVSAATAAQVQLKGNQIAQFVDQLPLLTVQGGSMETIIPGTGEITLTMREFKADVMPSSFVPAAGIYTGTTVWGYRDGSQPTNPAGTYIGPVFVATRTVPTKIRFVNDLGDTATSNLLFWKTSLDQTLHWADPLGGAMNACAMDVTPGQPPIGSCANNYSGPIPAVPHLHGGEVPPVLDGGPDAWFTSDGAYQGPTYYTGNGAAANEAIYRYPNSQEAGLLWFHDHLLGGTRLNVYAGLAGAYLLTDPGLALPPGLNPAGLQQGTDATTVDYLIPLVIQDRSFDVNGELFFPNAGINPEHPFWIPEFVGDTVVVNGKVWPYLNVERRRYRFLFINGSNARAYELFLIDPISGAKGPAMWQIGTDGGYLDAPVKIDPNAAMTQLQKLVLMPGERADVIVDFSGVPSGTNLILRNTARTPYPGGAPAAQGTMGRIMQIRVSGTRDTEFGYNPATLPPIPIRSGGQRIVRLPGTPAGPAVTAANVQNFRQLTLNEVMAAGGPLEVLVNNTKWSGMREDGSVPAGFTALSIGGITEYLSELPNEGDTEIWEIVNLTEDAHPIHTHLTQFQVVSRQPFNTNAYLAAYGAAFPGGMFIPAYGPPLDYATGNPRALGGNPDITPYLLGLPVPPPLNERGWKDTVRVMPGEVTRFVVRYAPLDKALNDPDLNYPFDPNALERPYVWHCHIIDHEDNEMMRPYSVVPTPHAKRPYKVNKDY